VSSHYVMYTDRPTNIVKTKPLFLKKKPSYSYVFRLVLSYPQTVQYCIVMLRCRFSPYTVLYGLKMAWHKPKHVAALKDGVRYLVAAGRLIIWRPPKQILFKLLCPKLGLAKLLDNVEKLFREWKPGFTRENVTDYSSKFLAPLTSWSPGQQSERFASYSCPGWCCFLVNKCCFWGIYVGLLLYWIPSWRSLWRPMFCGVWRRQAWWKFTSVSEEDAASIISL